MKGGGCVCLCVGGEGGGGGGSRGNEDHTSTVEWMPLGKEIVS